MQSYLRQSSCKLCTAILQPASVCQLSGCYVSVYSAGVVYCCAAVALGLCNLTSLAVSTGAVYFKCLGSWVSLCVGFEIWYVKLSCCLSPILSSTQVEWCDTYHSVGCEMLDCLACICTHMTLLVIIGDMRCADSTRLTCTTLCCRLQVTRLPVWVFALTSQADCA